MSNNIKYWKGEEELNRDPQFLADQKREFGEALPLEQALSDEGFELNSNRRDFLKYFGFSVTAVALASCYKTNVRHAVPYLVKPEEVTPGVANYYRSTCGGCTTSCGVEVKVREGRPIKLDGSPDSVISKGGLCATGQASILSLYDTERLANPLVKNQETQDWSSMDKEIMSKLNDLNTQNKKVVLLSNTINSPTTLKAIELFKQKYANVEHVSYDAISYHGILEANASDFNKRAIPHYLFGQAKAIVSFGADFLGTWISPVEFQSDYVRNRRPDAEGGMSVHIQFESQLSMTGTNADHRFPMKASMELAYVANLYNYIAKAKGIAQLAIPTTAELAGNSIEKAAKLLLKNTGKSLVVSGSNSVEVQKIVNAINMLLDNYSSTIDLVNPSNQYNGNDAEVQRVFDGLNKGDIAGVILYGANPVFNHNKEWSSALAKASLTVSFASTKNESAIVCQYIAPDNHFLESWSDNEPVKGIVHFTQPTIAPVFNTRQAQESLLIWAGAISNDATNQFADKGILSQKLEATPFYTYLRNQWEATIGADAFKKGLELGYVETTKNSGLLSYSGNVSGLTASISQLKNNAESIDLILYSSVAVKDGSQGNNPWLYEMPDPVSKVCWDNYVALPKSLAAKLGVTQDATVTIEANGFKYENVPAFIQPGQANQTVSVALGFGHTHAGKVGGSIEKGFAPVGFNAYSFMNSNRGFVVSDVKISKGSEKYVLAQTQTHHSIEGRDLVRESTFTAWKSNPNAGNEKSAPHIYTIWEKAEYRKDGSPNHLWGMAIDLNACTGCGSCIVSCSIENNVPVVGRDEIRLRREMHWIRIDRYYSFVSENQTMTREKEIGAVDASDKGEFKHWENVSVIHQPMMCQHCAQAPCETVCPVLATSHSSEGLNQMTYNRCIGTKYCGNNCPYKVRRFNWFRYNDNDKFDFHFNNPLGKMVINPDVTVRTRGVMEKCSFCVQKIQEAKLKVKRSGGNMNEVKVETACQRACPSNAIVFGDLHNKDSEISKLYRNERAFSVLDELNVQSSVKYMTKIRNTETI
jgi:MoCo/4Fe-4S cofactor protein with predicted Tat translocation signal